MRTLYRLCVVASLAGAAAPRLTAQTSTATTADFRWLVGTWRGHLNGDSTAVTEMTFMEPRARTMVGSMHLVQRDTVLVVELITMADSPRGLELRFRHFSTELDAYETQFKQAMQHISHSADRDVFENTVPFDKDLMSTQPRTSAYIRTSPNTFTAHSDIIGSNGKPAVIEVVYERVAPRK